jgi:UDP-N-acetylmuramoyl-L-alanyl-D-glutamate--2,6-diaminopimelate ligase
MARSLHAICEWIRAAAPGAELASDSRRIRPGDVFFAYPGEAADGRRFIGAAIENGAAAVVYEESGFAWDDSLSVPHRAVAGLKANAGPVAHAYYGKSHAAMFTVGVTGTNGKTSCALWTAQALASLGETAAVIGTLGVGLVRNRAEPATPRRTRCCWRPNWPSWKKPGPARWRSKCRRSAWSRTAPSACTSTSPCSPT